MTEPLSIEELRLIASRAGAATPGPWTSIGLWFELGPPGSGSEGPLAREEDAVFIAQARTDIPRLLAEIERLQAVVTRYRQFVEDEQQRWLAAARELTKEITEARGLSYREAMVVARDLIEANLRHRTREEGEER